MRLRDSSTLALALAILSPVACHQAAPVPVVAPTARVSAVDSALVVRRHADSLARATRRRDSIAMVRHEDTIRRHEDTVRTVVTTARTTIFAAVHFDPGHADIRSADQPLLDRKAALLVQNPNMRLRVFGYANDRGSDAKARQLGLDRALAVRTYLIAHGVDSAHVSVVSNGDARLLCRSADSSCQSRNARDEFSIIAGGAEITPDRD